MRDAEGGGAVAAAEAPADAALAFEHLGRRFRWERPPPQQLGCRLRPGRTRLHL